MARVRVAHSVSDWTSTARRHCGPSPRRERHNPPSRAPGPRPVAACGPRSERVGLERDVPAVGGGAVGDVVFEVDDATCSGEAAPAGGDRVMAAAVYLGTGRGVELAGDLERGVEHPLRIGAAAGLIGGLVEAADGKIATGRLECPAGRLVLDVSRVDVD